MSNVIDIRPNGIWARAYRALYSSESDKMACEAYMNGPDFRADNGLRVTDRDYERAFRELDWREKHEAIALLNQDAPAVAAAIVDAIDPLYDDGGAA